MLVDAVPREHWNAVQAELIHEHARQCETCRDVLTAGEQLDARLRAMPEARMSESLVPAVMACIAREHGAPAKASKAATRVRARKSWQWWTISSGAVLALGAYVAALLLGQSIPLGFGRFSFDILTGTRPLDPLVPLAVMGLVLCIVGIGRSGETAQE
jgi:hypothetical protein